MSGLVRPGQEKRTDAVPEGENMAQSRGWSTGAGLARTLSDFHVSWHPWRGSPGVCGVVLSHLGHSHPIQLYFFLGAHQVPSIPDQAVCVSATACRRGW